MRKLERECIKFLRKKNIAEPKNSLKILKQEAFRRKSPLPKQIKILRSKVWQRSFHYPVQYLCQSWPFRSLDLVLRPPILIPRFETEFMVSLILQKVKEVYGEDEIPGIRFLDLGCGSGAIGLSLSKQLSINGELIDIDQRCVTLAQKNAERNQCRINGSSFLTANMEDHLEKICSFDIVVSNPPYLSEQHYKKYLKYQVKGFEDRKALVADENGMKFIRMISNYWRKERQKKGILALEFDERRFEVEDEWLEEFVMNDQYNRRRFIFMIK